MRVRSEVERKQNKARALKWRDDNRERWNANKRKAWKRRNEADRAAALAEYGDKCKCCGETTQRFLTIDHINGKGSEHRKKIGRPASYAFYTWLRLNGYPKGFQVLCWNCNCGRHFNGGVCPHKDPRWVNGKMQAI